ncbi:MAG: SET domain-containing protein [Alphaproteobacteria bacterium]|nr:SET domain-containing protein [Alphaproteobacteria bacterium]
MNMLRVSEKLSNGVSPHGRALIALDDISQGEVIISLEGRVVSTVDKYTIQIEEGRHLAPEGNGWALANHSCLPNAAVDFSRFAMIALTHIRPGEEVTFNYLTTEMDMVEPFFCGCGAPHCPGTVAGFRHLSRPQKLALRPHLSAYLARDLGE